MSHQRAPAPRRTGLALLAGLMAGTQAMAASDHILQVSVTILPRIACQAHGQSGEGSGRVAPLPAPSADLLRCRSTEPSVTYRVRSESGAADSGAAAVLVVEP